MKNILFSKKTNANSENLLYNICKRELIFLINEKWRTEYGIGKKKKGGERSIQERG